MYSIDVHAAAINRAGIVPENTGKCLHFIGDTGDNAHAC